MKIKDIEAIVERTLHVLSEYDLDDTGFVPYWISQIELEKFLKKRRIYELRRHHLLNYSRFGTMYFYKLSDIKFLIDNQIINIDYNLIKDKHILKNYT